MNKLLYTNIPQKNPPPTLTRHHGPEWLEVALLLSFLAPQRDAISWYWLVAVDDSRFPQ